MKNLDKLFDIVRTLRGENGCAWDKKQTPLSMWKCLAEETYELRDAIVKNDIANILEELGDVIFQLVFIIEMFEELEAFSFRDVVNSVAAKMIRRHPHVYSDAVVETKEELDRQWDAIKQLEQKGNRKNRNSVMDGVPKGMPSLLRALKVSKCAVKSGFEWDDIHGVVDTVRSELDEFEAALESGDDAQISMEFGDILFSLVNVARFAGFHPETALAESTAKFEGRFRLMETMLKQKQIRLADLTSEEVETLWSAAKQAYDR